jgi:hypothetical protein
MRKVHLKGLLSIIEKEIDHDKSPKTRATAILEKLQEEESKLKSFSTPQNVANAASSNQAMFDWMNKFELYDEVVWAIKIVETYVKNDSFVSIVPANQMSDDIAECVKEINETLKTMILKCNI